MMEAKGLNNGLLTKKNGVKGMTAYLEKSAAHAILDRLKEGKSVPQHLILIALKVTEALSEDESLRYAESVDSRSASDRHGARSPDIR